MNTLKHFIQIYATSQFDTERSICIEIQPIPKGETVFNVTSFDLGFIALTLMLIFWELRFRVVVRACYGANFVAQDFKYLAPNFVSGRPA